MDEMDVKGFLVEFEDKDGDIYRSPTRKQRAIIEQALETAISKMNKQTGRASEADEATPPAMTGLHDPDGGEGRSSH